MWAAHACATLVAAKLTASTHLFAVGIVFLVLLTLRRTFFEKKANELNSPTSRNDEIYAAPIALIISSIPLLFSLRYFPS